MGEGKTTAWPGEGDEDRCSSDMQEREKGKEKALIRDPQGPAWRSLNTRK
jgi:hypothetical protein